jgi:hypothetical protein
MQMPLTVASREEAIQYFYRAIEGNPFMREEHQRRGWAERTVDRYLAMKQIVVDPQMHFVDTADRLLDDALHDVPGAWTAYRVLLDSMYKGKA